MKLLALSSIILLLAAAPSYADVPVPAHKPKDIAKKIILKQDKKREKQVRQMFFKGQVSEAGDIAHEILMRSGGELPMAGWIAGLSAWKAQNYKLSALYFEMTALSQKADGWMRAASSYWAARAAMRAGQQDKVTDLLNKAAVYNDTFYGLLASVALGRSAEIQVIDRSPFPVSHWRPQSGYKISKALLHAIILQESRFDPEARSKMGARGLMQIMPSTAQYVTGRATNSLYHPAKNIEIGQAYLLKLMSQKGIDGDLISTLIAYNAGPGNLRRWKERVGSDSDPLYFIEAIPSAETRAYVERVLYTYWAYQMNDGERPLSLAQVAQGRWGLYDGPLRFDLALNQR